MRVKEESEKAGLKFTFKSKDHGIQSHHFMENGREKSGNGDRFYFLGLQNTADSDCSQEIKRCLLLERKALTNLDRVLKSRDITLSTKVHTVKALAFHSLPSSRSSYRVSAKETSLGCQQIQSMQTISK